VHASDLFRRVTHRPQRSAFIYNFPPCMLARQDLTEWLNVLLDGKVTDKTLMSALQSGQLLCQVAGKINASEKKANPSRKLPPPPLRPLAQRQQSMHMKKKKQKKNRRDFTLFLPSHPLIKYYLCFFFFCFFCFVFVSDAFHCRDNIVHFLEWARAFGVPAAVLFEADDLVEQKNEKQVLNCLMEARANK
jgi:hypothetical protein